MARFLVWSDLHDELWGGFDLPDLSAPVDGVLIAGDTHTLGRHLEIPARAARKYNCPVVLIWRNHEPDFMRPFGFPSVVPQIRSASSFRARNVA